MMLRLLAILLSVTAYATPGVPIRTSGGYATALLPLNVSMSSSAQIPSLQDVLINGTITTGNTSSNLVGIGIYPNFNSGSTANGYTSINVYPTIAGVLSNYTTGIASSGGINNTNVSTADVQAFRAGYDVNGSINNFVNFRDSNTIHTTGVLSGQYYGFNESPTFQAGASISKYNGIFINPNAGAFTIVNAAIAVDVDMTQICANTSNCWGVKIEDSLSDNYFAKDVVIGGASSQPSNSSVGLEVNGTNKSILFPRLTTAQRNALTATAGMVVFNTSTGTLDCYTGSWGACNATGSGANTTLSNLGTTSINAALIPNADNSVNLGTNSLKWGDGYIYKLRDGSGQIEVDLTARRLYDSSTNLSLDWQAKTLGNTAGATVLDWSGSALLQKVHIQTTGTTPTIGGTAANCGVGATIVGNDNAGRLIVNGGGGTSSSCTITFAASWTNAPICQVTDETTTLLIRASATASVITISATTPFGSGDNLVYRCVGYQ